MISRPLISSEKFRSERSSELLIACDVTYNSIAVVFYDKAMKHDYARISLVGEEIPATAAVEKLTRLVVTAMREFSISASCIEKVGIAAPVHVEQVMEQELTPSDMYLNPDTELLFVPFISAGISGRFTASLLTVTEGDFIAADVGRTVCIAENSSGKIRCASFPLVGAFDGSDLEVGMPAENGAVEALRREADGTVAYEVVGDGEGKGVSPCAAVMAAAVMMDCGILDSDGIMTDRDMFFVGEDIFVSQKDVRALQTDKARTAAALELFPEKTSAFFSGEPFARPEGFRDMLRIGAVPEKFSGASFCRNSAERGIILFLESEECRKRAFSLASAACDITEEIYHTYHENYLNYLNFDV